MSSLLNETHDPALRSWVASANQPGHGMPIQNLPFAVFRPRGDQGAWRIGVGIGDDILDLTALAALTPFSGLAGEALAACREDRLNALMALGSAHASALRLALSRLLREGAALQPRLDGLRVAQAQAEFTVPARIGNYTDFYISEHHATSVGRQFRPDNPLLPNYKWVPIGYHGRASSIGVSGQTFHRPYGQTRPAAEGAAPGFGPCQRLDHELELAVWLGTGNAQGEPVPLDAAESHVFGLGLLNDWSARDLQAWEYQPLGPFLAKNFASTVSPWVVSLEALAPYRLPFTRDPADPQPLPYLDSAAHRASSVFDIQLEVLLTTAQSRAAGAEPASLSRSRFRDAYWTVAQMVAHHTVNGCNLQPGDLLGTGTLSSPGEQGGGSLLELSEGGKRALTLPWGETRRFLEDGDEIILRGWCEAPGHARISLGECRGQVLPAR